MSDRMAKVLCYKQKYTGRCLFIIPKKDMTVRTISDFRELNKRIVRRPFPIPKISTTLQELEGFTYATALDLNMGYYTIKLDPNEDRDVYHQISLRQILLPEIANGNECFSRHLPIRNDGPNGTPIVCTSIH